MTAKHTPGPWTVIEHSWSSTGIYAGDKRIADLDIYDDATEENEDALAAEMLANAKLMAAAQDLLAVAIEALAVIPRIKPEGNGNGTEVRLRAAIAKATA